MAGDLTRLLLLGVPVDFVAGPAAAAGTAWLLRSQLLRHALLGWLALLLGAHLARLSAWAATRRQPALREHPRRALLLARLCVLAVGAAWGVLPGLLMPESTLQALFVATVICAVCGAGVAEYSPDLPSSLLFVVPMLLPLLARLLAAHAPLLRDAAGLVALYFVYLLHAAWRTHGQFQRIALHRAHAAAQLARDELTGLGSRLDLDARLRDALERARRQCTELAVGYIDLNDFKPVNDRYGHAAGDRLLRELARRWREQLRHDEFLARIGGDEFVILVEELQGTQATRQLDAVFERMHRAAALPFMLDGQPVRVGMTIGVARFPHDATEPAMLLRQADAAMYQGKQFKGASRSWWHGGLRDGRDTRSA